MEPTYSTPVKLSELEEVTHTRTPVWDIGGSGDIRIKLDTDVNNQEWYVIEDDSKYCGCFHGEVACWAFPHWNGANDFYRYIPTAFCFKTFAELLASPYIEHVVNCEIWAYQEEEYEQRRRPGHEIEEFFAEVEQHQIAQDHAALRERIKSWGLESHPFRLFERTKLND